MRKLMVWIAAAVMSVCSVVYAQEADVSGNWQGTLQVGQGLRTLIKIAKADGGGWKGTFYSIDQGGQPIGLSSVTVQGLNFGFSLKVADLTYAGTLNADRTMVTGSMTQGGQTHPFNLERVSDENAFPIPQPLKKMAADADPGFDVATIKPSAPGHPGKGVGFRGRHFVTGNFNMDDLIGFAYGLHLKQVVGAPEWFGTDLFDIDGVPDVEGQPSQKQMTIMVQKLLKDRFKLQFHHEKRDLSVFAITLGKGEPKMDKSTVAANDPQGFGFRRLGDLTVHNMTMADFASWMQTVLDRPVVDHTGLTERYDFKLLWTPDDSQFAQFRGTGVTVPPPTDDATAPPGLYTAIQEQLNLKLEPVKAADDVIVIDHVEKPSAN